MQVFASDYFYKLKGSALGGFPTNATYARAGIGSELFSYSTAIDFEGISPLTYLSWDSEILNTTNYYIEFPDPQAKMEERLNITDDRWHIVQIFRSGDEYTYGLKFGTIGSTFPDNEYDKIVTEADLNQYYFCFQYVEFDESMIVNRSIWEIGDRIVPIRDIGKPNKNVTLYEGTVYEVIRLMESGLPVINSYPSVILGEYEQTLFRPADEPNPDTPHEDNGFYTGESFAYVLNPTGQPVMVGLKFTIELELFRKDGGYQIYGKRKNAVVFSGARVWANPYDIDSWIRDDNDWFQLNTFGVGSVWIDGATHNAWSNKEKVFEIGDTIAENETYICTLGFNKVPIQNPRKYGPTYYDYTYVDIYMPITWSLE